MKTPRHLPASLPQAPPCRVAPRTLNKRTPATGLMLMVLALVWSGTGCDNAKQGAASGAAVGALSGLAIGSLSGNAGTGAAIGAIAGGVGGAVIGEQNRREQERYEQARRAQPGDYRAVPYDPQRAADPQRASLAKFQGRWSVTGWVRTLDGRTLDVQATATGNVEQNYFLVLDMAGLRDERRGEPVSGTAILGAEPGLGLTLTTRFNTLSSAGRYVGNVSGDGSLYSLALQEPTGNGGFVRSNRRFMTIRFLGPNEWQVDVQDRRGGRLELVESLVFRRG